MNATLRGAMVITLEVCKIRFKCGSIDLRQREIKDCLYTQIEIENEWNDIAKHVKYKAVAKYLCDMRSVHEIDQHC